MYTIYTTKSIAELREEKAVATANTPKEAVRAINNYLVDNNIAKERYMRFLFNPDVTTVDYGSYSTFMAIVPPLSISDLEDTN